MKSPVNIPLMLLSLALSVVMWLVVYVQNAPPEAPQKVAIRLRLENLDSTRFVAVDAPTVFRTMATGSDDRIRDMRKDEMLEAIVDLSEAQVGKRPYRVRIVPEKYRDLFDSSVLDVMVTVDERAEKAFKVYWDASGELSDNNLRLDDVSVEPPKITIEGARSLVEKIARVRTVVDLGDVDLEARKPQASRVEVLDSAGKPIQGIKVDPPMVNVQAIVNPAPQERLAFVQPTIIGAPNSDYSTTGYLVVPNQVVARGQSQVMARLNQISTQSIDISGLTKTRTFTVGLLLPSGVSSARPSTVRVIVYVKRTFPETVPPINPTRPSGDPK